MAESPVAQTTAPVNAPTNEEVTLPRLTRFVEAVWPRSETPRPKVSTLFAITINAQGKVTETTVLESAGVDFDRAATTAVALFEFAEPEEPKPRESPPEPSIQPPTADPSTEPTGAKRARAPTEPAPEAPPTGQRSTPPSDTAPTDDAISDESYSAVAQIAAPPREVTRHTVAREDLTKIPGTSGDALRAIEVMPGVARTSITSGDPILRGAAWNESRSYIEGATVPYLYHFGGVKSAFNSRLLSRVDLYPGNYGTSFGRGTGGVVSAKIRDPMRDRFHALE